MNKNNIVTKHLFHLNIDASIMTVDCVYNVKTNFISIRTGRYKYYRHNKQSIIQAVNKRMSVCDILKDHAKNMKNDPERLSTAFLQKMIGIKCSGA